MKRSLFHMVLFTFLVVAVNARAQCELARHTCQPDRIASFEGSRVHIRCINAAAGSIRFFAVPTATPEAAVRLLQFGIAALTNPRNPLVIEYCPTDLSGANVGCRVDDCRLAVNLFLDSIPQATAAAETTAPDH